MLSLISVHQLYSFPLFFFIWFICLIWFMCTLHQNSSAPLLTQTLHIPYDHNDETRRPCQCHCSFSYSAPSAWKSLPLEIRCTQSTIALKTALKTHLYKTCYLLLVNSPSLLPPPPPPPHFFFFFFNFAKVR